MSRRRPLTPPERKALIDEYWGAIEPKPFALSDELQTALERMTDVQLVQFAARRVDPEVLPEGFIDDEH